MLLIRMLGSLVVVGGLLWLLARTAKKQGLGSGGRELIDVRAQRGLSRNASVVLVRVGARNLLLGVGDDGVRLLMEVDDLALHSDPPTAGHLPSSTPVRSPSRSIVPLSTDRRLDRWRERTVRKPR